VLSPHSRRGKSRAQDLLGGLADPALEVARGLLYGSFGLLDLALALHFMFADGMAGYFLDLAFGLVQFGFDLILFMMPACLR
jgi:hypothetical protein